MAALGYVPSFCTACYRLGRTGADFMDLARPGEIKDHCQPNALATFREYLDDFASPETRAAGEAMIRDTVAGMDAPTRQDRGDAGGGALRPARRVLLRTTHHDRT